MVIWPRKNRRYGFGGMISMRKLLFLISFAIYISSPAVAADNYAAEIQRVKKDECLLVALNCPQPNLKPQEQIRRLRDELDKGSSVYTPE
jgi:hypothetical protein